MALRCLKTMLMREIHCLPCIIAGSRGMKQWEYDYLGELYRRRLIAGPVVPQPRSKRPNWNYETELYCFAKRLSEEINGDLLRQAFTSKSYTDSFVSENESSQSSSEGGASVAQLTQAPVLQNYEPLRQIGEEFSKHCLNRFLTDKFPNLPKEGVSAILNYLMSTQILHHIASNLAVTELILVQEFPVPHHVVAEVFLAIVGALKESQGEERAACFVRDFVLSELIGQDLDEIYEIKNPLSKLSEILKHQGRGEPEPRLISHSGQETVMACYHVGIYSDKRLIGRGPGETVSIAEEMAAHDALMTIYGICENHKPIDFSKISNTKLLSVESEV